MLIVVLLILSSVVSCVQVSAPIVQNTPPPEVFDMGLNVALTHAEGSYTNLLDFVPNTGAIESMYDDDLNTAFGRIVSGTGSLRMYGYIDITLDETITASSLALYAKFIATGVVSPTRTWSIAYWSEASLSFVTLSSGSTIGDATNYGTVVVESSFTTNKIRISFNQRAFAETTQTVAALVYEIKIFVPWNESAVRINNSEGGVKLACYESGASSALRYADGGSVQSFVLVNKASAFASPVRVRHGGVTYAIAKYM